VENELIVITIKQDYFMGCKQCKVISAVRVDKEELDIKESTEPSATITQRTSVEPNNSKRNTIVVFRNPATISRNLVNKPDLVVDSVIRSDSEEVPDHLEHTESDTPIGSTESFDYQDIGTKGITNKSDEPNPLNNTIDRQISTDSEELPIFREKLLIFGAMDAIVSYISDDGILAAATLNESAGSYSVYEGLSSSLVDPEDTARRKDTVARFMSPEPNRFDIQREATHNELRNDSNGYYSPRDSMESTGSDEPGAYRKLDTKNIFVRSKKSNTQQQKSNANETFSESGDLDLHPAKGGNSTSKDLRVMKDHLQTILSSATTKLSNPDNHPKVYISESSSESNES
jgi:hypothetical protein